MKPISFSLLMASLTVILSGPAAPAADDKKAEEKSVFGPLVW